MCETNIEDRLSNLLANDRVKNNPHFYEIVNSFRNWFDRKGELSDKQLSLLNKIEWKTSDEFITRQKEWREQWNDEKRQVAKICAKYYRSRGIYFFDLATSILEDPNFIPTEKQYKAMCENKYAKKVVEAALSDPKYPVGTFVAARQKCPHNVRNALSNSKAGVVIEAGLGLALSAAKGAKLYKVLPVGGCEMIQVEERYIKKAKIKNA